MRGLSIFFAFIAVLSGIAYIWFSSTPVSQTATEPETVEAQAAPSTPTPEPGSELQTRSLATLEGADMFGGESAEFDGLEAAAASSRPSNPGVNASEALRLDFRSRPVAYNRPPATMALNKPVDISLVIDATPEGAPATGLDGFDGEIIERDVALTDIVAAQLTGPAFDITPLSIERQRLSQRTQNRWQWTVTPTETGEHTLILEIFGFAQGDDAAEPLDAYRDRIAVEVRQLDRLVSFAQENEPVFGVFAAIAGFLSAMFGFFRWRLTRAAK